MPTDNDSSLAAAGQLPSRTLIGEGQVSNDITAREEVSAMAAGMDWLQMTILADAAPLSLVPDFLSAGELFGGEGEAAPPGWVRQLQYDRCAALAPGGYVMWSVARPSQGVHFRLNGGELSALREAHDLADEMLLDWVHERVRTAVAVNVTRCDLFVDWLGSGCPVEPLARAVQDGAAVSRAFLDTRYSQGQWGPAWTVYVGRRKSGKYVRVYDKGRELAERSGRFDGERTRLEIEFRGDYAKALFAERLSPVAVAKLVLNTAAAMVGFPVEWWEREVVAGNVGRLVVVPADGERDTLAWLEKVALPAIVRAAPQFDSMALLLPLCEAVFRASEGNLKARRLLSDGLPRSWLLRAAGEKVVTRRR
jgi:Putative phage replication protein RstA